jgi:hypothetical protein
MKTQKEFLNEVKEGMGLTWAAVANRFSVPMSTLSKWLAPESSDEYRSMSAVVLAYMREALENSRGHLYLVSVYGLSGTYTLRELATLAGISAAEFALAAGMQVGEVKVFDTDISITRVSRTAYQSLFD